MLETIRDWWAVIVGGIAALIWLSRLEWRGLQNEAEIKRLWAQRKEDLQTAQKSREETAEMLKEIRGDIKTLLSKRD